MHVLIVDDNDADLLLAAEAFAEVAPDVRLDTAVSGDLALASLRARADGERPDVVIVDVNMPGMDGFELLRTIRSDPALHALPVLVLTSSAAPDDVARAEQLRADAYLAKPREFREFLGTVADVVERWSTPGRGRVPHPGGTGHAPRSTG